MCVQYQYIHNCTLHVQVRQPFLTVVTLLRYARLQVGTAEKIRCIQINMSVPSSTQSAHSRPLTASTLTASTITHPHTTVTFKLTCAHRTTLSHRDHCLRTAQCRTFSREVGEGEPQVLVTVISLTSVFRVEPCATRTDEDWAGVALRCDPTVCDERKSERERERERVQYAYMVRLTTSVSKLIPKQSTTPLHFLLQYRNKHYLMVYH